MNTSLPFARRGRTAVTTTLAAAVLALSLTGCGGDAADAETTTATDAAASSVGTAASTEPTPESSAPAAPETDASASTPDEASPTLASLGERDDEPRVEFPGTEALFPDGSNASSDGKTMTVTTAAEETVSFELPTESEGWFHGTTVFLGEAGIGYVVTQSAGEFLHTFLVVLDGGELYVAEPDDEVVFGQFAGEGPFFETYTTEAGDHLVTRVEDGPSGEEYYEWTVEDRTMVPTLLS